LRPRERFTVMRMPISAVLVTVLLGGAAAAAQTPAPAPPIATTFDDRVAQLSERIVSDRSAQTIDAGTAGVLEAGLNAARSANAANDARGPSMLDAIDRALASYDRVLSAAENGRIESVRVGEGITVAMRDSYVWRIDNSARTVLAPHVGVMWIRGVQGAFTAKKPGVATLTLYPQPASTGTAPTTLPAPVRFTIVVVQR
jgi:hypothetical protein